MRKVQIHIQCDFCWQEGETEVQAVYSFALGIREGLDKAPIPKTVELCDDHAKPILELIEATAKLLPFQVEKSVHAPPPRIAAGHAAAVQDRYADKPPSSRPQECRECGETVVSTSALVTHVWNRHAAMKRPAAPARCPDCGTTARNATGMASHRRNEHGFDTLEDAYAHVIPGGDEMQLEIEA